MGPPSAHQWAADPTIRSIASGLPDNIMLVDVEGRIQFINWTVPDLTPDAVVGTPVARYVPEAFRTNITRCLQRVRETRHPDRYETAYVAEDGEVSHWESRVGAVEQDGELVGFTIISSNVTERRKAAADRDRLFNLSIDLLTVADDRGYLVRINPAFERVTGYSEQELTSKPYLDFVHPDDRQATLDAVARLARGQTVLDFENRYQHKGGRYRTFSWRAIRDPERGVVYGVGRDVTDQKILEQQVRQSQKMDAIGQLAGGVAHDFNNLVLAIQGNAEFAKRTIDAEARLDHLLEIERAAQRAADLTRQLLAFSRRQRMNVSSVDLNALSRELIRLLQRLIAANVDIDFIPGDELALVRGDPSQLEQVLMNLCLNARDAMPDGGRLTIRSENVLVDERYPENHPGARPGRSVLLSVTDTGVGMTAEVQERIFEPFFTTKAAGQGTGLGLATVYGIVQEHGGTLHVRSELGQGTTVEVYLPASEHCAAADDEKAGHVVRGGHEGILVAEDEQMVRSVVVQILESAGYEVFSASDGIEAMAVFRQQRSTIALALLDVVMPRCGGPDAYDQIQAQEPGLPVIFTSGYNDTSQRRPLPGQAILQKPYRPQDLLRRVREVLDNKGL